MPITMFLFRVGQQWFLLSLVTAPVTMTCCRPIIPRQEAGSMILNKFTRKKTALFLIVQTFCCATGFSENPRWKTVDVTSIPTRADLDVRWEASTKMIPSNIRIYRILPNKFSPEVISNVMTLCSFTEKDETGRNTNGTTFQNSAGSQKLSISFPSGSIHYEIPERRYGPTNLA